MSFLLGRQVRSVSFWEYIWAARKVMSSPEKWITMRWGWFAPTNFIVVFGRDRNPKLVFFPDGCVFSGTLTCPVHIGKNPSHCFCEVISLRWVLSFNRQLGRPTLTTGHPKTQFCFGCFLEHLSTIHFFQALGWTVPQFHLVCPPEGRGFKASTGDSKYSKQVISWYPMTQRPSTKKKKWVRLFGETDVC